MAVYSVISDNVSLTVAIGSLPKAGVKIRSYTVIRFINGPKIACGLFDSKIAGMPISPVFHAEDMETPIIRTELL